MQQPAVGLPGPVGTAAWFGTQTGVVSRSGVDPGIYRTTDGGSTFTLVSPLRPNRFSVRNATEGVAILSSGATFLHTTDAGATWDPVQSPFAGAFPGYTMTCTAAAPTAAGWVLGSGHNSLLAAIPSSATEVPAPPFLPTRATGTGLSLAASPNPVRAGTDSEVALRFRLVEGGDFRVSVHDLAGRRVREIATGRLPRGEHVVRWDGRDDTGRPVASGVYLARLRSHGRTATARVVRLR
jgi:hypothetical protein